MASGYFEEHDCQELSAGEEPDHWLHLARLLLDSGLAVDLEMEFARIFGEEEVPGASKAFIDSLPDAGPEDYESGDKCAICLSLMSGGRCSRLPCRHSFHQSCIVPWVTRVASCPLCKRDLPTDDARYEEFKRQKERSKERDAMLEELHSSMFG